MLSQLAAAYYFLHFLVICRSSRWSSGPSRCRISITEAVLGEDKKAVLGENTTPATLSERV